MAITLKSEAEIAVMRQAGRIVADTLAQLRKAVKPGVTTAALDEVARENARRHNAVPSFLGYLGYPASLCTSVNEQIVHGIPSKKVVLREGDIVSLDFGVIFEGWQGDSAITVGVGEVSAEASFLMKVTEESLQMAIAQVRPGNHMGNLSYAVQEYAEGHGFSVVRKYVGHGIGRKMHEQPDVPNFGVPGRGVMLKPGMVLAIEPMVNVGTYETRELKDGWTVVTADGSLSAHFEHTVAVTPEGAEVLTLP